MRTSTPTTPRAGSSPTSPCWACSPRGGATSPTTCPRPAAASGPSTTPRTASRPSSAEHMMDSTTGRARPLVALGYEPCCVPAMQLVEATAGLCDLLWMIDTAVPGRGEMAEFLNRFGPVVDLKGMSTEQAVKTLANWEPAGMTTYLNDGMGELATLAEGMCRLL